MDGDESKLRATVTALLHRSGFPAAGLVSINTTRSRKRAFAKRGVLMIERLTLKKLAILSALCGVSALCIAQNSTSGGQSANARDAGAHALEEVVITGSRRAQCSVLESMSPIDVIGLDDIYRQGCHRGAKISIRRVGAEFRSRYGIHSCGITAIAR